MFGSGLTDAQACTKAASKIVMINRTAICCIGGRAYFFCDAFNFAHRARCALAIAALPAAEIFGFRLPGGRPTFFPPPSAMMADSTRPSSARRWLALFFKWATI